MKWIALILSLALAGCGDEALLGGNGKNKDGGDPASVDPAAPRPGETARHSMYVADTGALPACDAGAEGWLVYVKAEEKFKACLAGAWADVQVKGGETRITSTILCSGPMEGVSLWFTYNVAVMNSGDVFVNAAIRDGYAEIGSTAFYSAQQAGAAIAAVTFQNDQAAPANAGFWVMSLDRATLTLSIQYSDADIGAPMTWIMTPDKCLLQSY